MPNIIKKNEGQVAEWDPMRTMREWMKWDPFREMSPFLHRFEREGMAFNPTFDIRENKDAYVLKADVPGVKPEELEVSLTGNRLQISGKREAEQEAKEDTYYTYERSFGTFARSFTLPEGIDTAHIRSELKDGVLTIGLPKLPEQQTKKIAIGTMASKH